MNKKRLKEIEETLLNLQTQIIGVINDYRIEIKALWRVVKKIEKERKLS